MMRQLLWIAAPLALLWAAQPGNAQIVFEFADASGTAQTNFSVPVGSTIPIRVFIHELAAGAPTLNSQGGLGTGAVRVRFNNPANIAAVLTTSDITSQGSWQFFTPGIGTGTNANTATFTGGTFSGILPSAQGRVELGTFLFHALSAGSTTLAAVDQTASAFDTSSFNTTGGVPNIDYDPLIAAGSATLTVTGVPEPTSLALAGIAAAGFVIRRRRATKHAQTPAV